MRLEEPVALVLDRSAEFVIAALGVLKAGGSYLPLDPHAPPRRLMQLFAQSGARWALTVAELRPKVAEWTDKIVEVDAALDDLLAKHNGAAALYSAVPSDPDRRAYLISTSGSTGAPKVVEIEHHSLTNLVCHYQHYLALTKSDRTSWLSPPTFDASVADLWPSLCSGATVVIPEKQYATDPNGLIAWIAKEAITIAFVSTPLAELLLRRSWPFRLALRYFGVGGDVLHVRPSPGLPFAVLNAYGPTENTVDAIWAIVHPGPASGRPPIGRPITNVTAHILDEQRRLVAPGEVGELYLGGEQVARGYLNDPQRTRECFIPDPFIATSGRLYRTGDLVRWNDDGELEFLGRIDLQVQIGGCRVELEEVESTLSRHPDVVEACCSPIKDGVVTRSLIAYVATATPSANLAGILRDFLRAELPAYMIPSKFIFLTKLPHTYAGKVDRAALAARPPGPPSPRRLSTTRSFDNKLHTLWRDLLPSAGDDETDKSFWDLGGDSLKLIQLSLGVEEMIGRHLSLPAFLRDPTLHGLRNAVQEELANSVAAWSERLHSTSIGNRPNRERLSSVVQLQEGTGSLPLYFICPSPNEIRLAQMIGAGRPIFGVDAPWPLSWRDAATNNKKAALPTIEQFAAPLAAALATHLGTSMCVLAGYSTMGVVAFEVAHQLQRLGAKVELVILLDTWRMRPPRLYLRWAARWARLLNRWRQADNDAQAEPLVPQIGFHLRRASLIFSIMISKGTKKIFRFFSSRNLAAHGPPRRAIGEVTSIFDEQGVPLEWGLVERLYENAENSYGPHRLDCRGVLFKVSPDNERMERTYDDTLGWKNLFSKGLEIISVPGNHFSMIRDESSKFMLANKIVDVLTKLR